VGADDAFRDRATLPAHPAGAAPSGAAETVKGGGPDPSEPTRTPVRSIGPFDEPRDRFESRDELGRGGMGVVVEAFDRALKRPVAIKQMQSASDVDLKRFEREAEITALLEHPGIVPIHDAGRSSDGLPYYVMRRIDGDPLDQVVAKKPYAERIAKMPNLLSACDAVGFAHARGVIHRDIKPSNILIGPFGETLVIDWGLARMLDDSIEPESIRNSDAMLTRVGSVAGTPGFMAPEQARGETLDARADVYALGATMFYVLADAVAITASGATEMIHFVGEGRTPEWEKLPDETPPELRAIIEKAMAPQRDDRYRDANELAADLRRYISGQFVRAYRYGLGEQIRVFVRRQRAAVAVGVIALAVILVGATISIRRILDERDEARRARAVAEANQREAAKTRDQLLIQHALHLSEKEPAAAIAALRQLGTESDEWGRAAAVAAAASAHGIPFGFAAPEVKETGLLAVSPDSRFLAVLRPGTERINVIDLERRTRQRFDLPATGFYIDWVDARTIAVGADRKVVIVDRDRGVVRSLPIPTEHSTFEPSSAGYGYLGDEAGNFYLIDATTTALSAPVIVKAGFVRTLDDGRAVVSYPDHVEVWSRSAPPLHVADGVPDRVALGKNRIATRIGPDICVWTLSSASVTREYCKSFDGYETPAAFIGDDVVVDATSSVFVMSATSRFVISDRSRVVYPQQTGILFFAGDSGIRLIDSKGDFTFSAGPLRLHRIAQTADERYIAGLATTGDVVVWDLSQFRPRSYAASASASVFDVTSRSIWLIDEGAGVYRIDRKTGTSELVVQYSGASRGSIDVGERWLLVGRVASGAHTSGEVPMEHTLFNLQTRTEVKGAPGDSFAFWRDLAMQIDRRGELWSISPDGTRERVGTFTGGLQRVGFHRMWLAGVTATDVCRYEHETRAIDCIPRPQVVDTIGVDAMGTCWIIGRGALWRWPTGTRELSRYWPSLTFSHLTWAGDQLLAAGTGVLLKIYDPVALPVAVPPMLAYMAGGENTIYGVTPNHTIAAIDVATGVATELPMRSEMFSGASASLDGAIAIASKQSIQMRKEIRVYVPNTPRERDELQRWLATVTNAMPIPGSDAVAWP